jgi:ABC-type sugar transport system ATPase subunit
MMNNTLPLIRMEGIYKYFGGVHALENVDFELYPNEILALIGNNGAGKSTLIKILSGVYKPDKGKIFIQNEEVVFNNPHEAKLYGIETVFQELALVDSRNVIENLFLGREIARSFFIKIVDNKKMESEAVNILKKLKIDIPNLKSEVGDLSGGQRQALAVGRAVSWGKKIIIMDEPTAALGVQEARKVLQFIKTLKEHGASVIVISHNLSHVYNVADRIFVLRGGHKVASEKKSIINPEEAVKLITGAELL